jgi:hypothetical protein
MQISNLYDGMHPRTGTLDRTEKLPQRFILLQGSGMTKTKAFYNNNNCLEPSKAPPRFWGLRFVGAYRLVPAEMTT